MGIIDIYFVYSNAWKQALREANPTYYAYLCADGSFNRLQQAKIAAINQDWQFNIVEIKE